MRKNTKKMEYWTNVFADNEKPRTSTSKRNDVRGGWLAAGSEAGGLLVELAVVHPLRSGTNGFSQQNGLLDKFNDLDFRGFVVFLFLFLKLLVNYFI